MRTIDADHLKSMLQEYIKREQAYIDIGNNKTIAIGHSNGLWEAIAQIDEEPTVEPQISGNAVNLCETCKYDFPECPKDSNVIFGDGKGNDNVCACNAYEVYTVPISKREWYQRGYKAGQMSVQPQRWISVTEMLPKDDEEVIVTCLDDSGDTPFSYTTVAWHYKGMWVCENERCPFVVAWLQLPEPYKGGQDEQAD